MQHQLPPHCAIYTHLNIFPLRCCDYTALQSFKKGAEHCGHALYCSAVYCVYRRMYHVMHCWIPIRKPYSFRLGLKLNISCNFSWFIPSFFFFPKQFHFQNTGRWHGENTADLLFFTVLNIHRLLKKYPKLCYDIKTKILKVRTKTWLSKH